MRSLPPARPLRSTGPRAGLDRETPSCPPPSVRRRDSGAGLTRQRRGKPVSRVGERQDDREYGSAPCRRIDRDPAAVGFNRPFRDRQPEAATPGVARSCFVDTVEAIEDPLAVLGGTPRPLAGDRERRLASRRTNANVDRRGFAAVLDRV